MNPPTPETPETRDAARRAAADAALARVQRETETIGTSSLAGQPRSDDPDEQPMDVWARRIGKGLGVLAALYMIWQLVNQIMATPPAGG